MGIVNASPGSFSDGSRYGTLYRQLELAQELLAAGADILDIGGESASTGRPPVEVTEEIERGCRRLFERAGSARREVRAEQGSGSRWGTAV